MPNFRSLFLQSFLPLALLLIGGGLFYAHQEMEGKLTRLQNLESTNVMLGAASLAGTLQPITQDLLFLSVHSALRSATNHPSPETLAHLAEDFSRFSDTKKIYDQIRWIDEKGMEIVRVDFRKGKSIVVPSTELQNKAKRYFFTDSFKLNVGEIFISPLDLNIEHDKVEIPYKPMIRLATPVVNLQGSKRGIVILNYYGQEMLQAFAKVTNNHSMLINTEGYWLKSPHPADEWGFMFKRPVLSMATRSPAAWKAITSSDRGQVVQEDGLWTWETVFPLLVGQKASTGNPDAAGTSFREIDARQYFWKSISHCSTDSLNAIRLETWLKVGGVLSMLLGLTGLVSWVLAQNISAQKRAEAKLVESQQAALAATAAKSQFLAMMSHEVRTPMNGILGMAQLLILPRLLDDKRVQYAQTILNSGHTLLSLLNDILDLSKVEAGKLNLESIVFAVEPVVADMHALFSETANAKGLQLTSAWKGPAGPCYLGDPYRPSQMLSNLISNAIKFTASGFVRIVAREIEHQSQHAVLEFSVSDSGIGMTNEQQSRLFQPFSQADSSTTRQYGGSGLGLSIVLQLAKLMEGEVGTDSEPGKGSRFWFRVRVALQTEAQESHQISAVAVPAQDLTGTMLIAEDNSVNRMVIMAMLGELGCSGVTVTVVEDGQQALDFITRGGAPDLVLMDIQMPIMNGLEATEKIRLWEADHGKPRMTIVALTANAFEEDRHNCLAAGMDDFLVKPLDLEKLQTMLSRWLG